MSERVPDMFARLQKWGSGPLFAAHEDDLVTIDGVQFLTGYEEASTSERFTLVKVPDHRTAFLDLLTEFHGGRIVELGIAEGGSTALIAITAAPAALLAVDIEPVPQPALEELIARRDLGRSVHTRYGLDQADREGLDRAVTEAIGDEPLDLVLDDASHELDPTRTSFEVLFPRLRHGGLYAIEDWSSDHGFKEAMIEHFRNASDEDRAALRRSLQESGGQPAAPTRRPLLDLAVELVLARALMGEGAIAEVIASRWWLMVRRGTEPLDQTFRLGDVAHDHFGYLG
jgi:predicted O-methyltransferase YrrM